MKTHGMYKSVTYSTWRAMISRCTFPRNKRFNRYGGRGIRVCRRWLGKRGFQNFLADMGERPAGATIGRIHNDGNYTPSNCEWQTIDEQKLNKVNVHRLTFDGETLTAKAWALKLGIDYRNLRRRLKRGLPIERVLLRRTI
jgi:hypothetical protein